MSVPPPDWQIQMSRAYAVFGFNLITTSVDDSGGPSVFAKWSHLIDALTPDERSKIAKGRTRSAKGTFEKERLKPGERLEGPEVRGRISVDPKTGKASSPRPGPPGGPSAPRAPSTRAAPGGPRPPGPSAARPERPRPPGPSTARPAAVPKPQAPTGRRPPGPPTARPATPAPERPRPPGPSSARPQAPQPERPRPPGPGERRPPGPPTARPERPRPPGPETPVERPAPPTRPAPPERPAPPSTPEPEKPAPARPSGPPQRPEPEKPATPEVETKKKEEPEKKPEASLSEIADQFADDPLVAAEKVYELREARDYDKSNHLTSMIDSQVRERIWKGEYPSDTRTPVGQDTPRGSGFKEGTGSGDNLGYRPGKASFQEQQNISREITTAYLAHVKNNPDDHDSLEDFVATAASRYTSRVLDQPQGLQVFTGAWSKILEEEALKTSFETGYGISGPSLRRPYEAKGMSVPEMQPDHLRPVYGYVGAPGRTNDQGVSSNMPGETILTMKPEVAERATVTAADSLKYESLGIPLSDIRDGTANPGDVLGMAGKKLNVGQAYKDAKEGSPHDFFHGGQEFVETQIHGGVPLSDIAEVTFQEDMRNRGFNQFSEYKNKDEILNMDDEMAMADIEEFVAGGLGVIGLSESELKQILSDPDSPEAKAYHQLLSDLKAQAMAGDLTTLAASPAWKEFVTAFFKSKGMEDVKVNFTKSDELMARELEESKKKR